MLVEVFKGEDSTYDAVGDEELIDVKERDDFLFIPYFHSIKKLSIKLIPNMENVKIGQILTINMRHGIIQSNASLVH